MCRTSGNKAQMSDVKGALFIVLLLNCVVEIGGEVGYAAITFGARLDRVEFLVDLYGCERRSVGARAQGYDRTLAVVVRPAACGRRSSRESRRSGRRTQSRG